jgi:hypothetical protein
MKPLRHPLLPDGHGHRTPQTLLLISAGNKLLAEAAKFFPGSSDREIARQLRSALSRYRDGRWRRDRSEALCPARSTVTELLWCVLKTRDHVPSERLIRSVLSRTASASARE